MPTSLSPRALYEPTLVNLLRQDFPAWRAHVHAGEEDALHVRLSQVYARCACGWTWTDPDYHHGFVTCAFCRSRVETRYQEVGERISELTLAATDPAMVVDQVLAAFRRHVRRAEQQTSSRRRPHAEAPEYLTGAINLGAINLGLSVAELTELSGDDFVFAPNPELNALNAHWQVHPDDFLPAVWDNTYAAREPLPEPVRRSAWELVSGEWEL